MSEPQFNALVMGEKTRRPATAQSRLDLAVTMLFFKDRVYHAWRSSGEITFIKYVAQKYFRLTFTVEAGRWGAIKERSK